MAGTLTGGRKAAAKNKAKNPNFYREIGSKGQQAYLAKPKEERKPRGFAANRDLASTAGAKGGRISRRGVSLIVDFPQKQPNKFLRFFHIG